jgi:mannose-1-phosphate guanylyltransferase
MKAVVLVGGEGTRLRPLTLSAPKQMLPIVGVPMIERVLGQLALHGVEEAILSLGYLPDAFTEAYPDGRAAGVGLTYAVEPEPLDTAGAVRFAATFAGIKDTFVVVNGDVLTDLDLTSLVAFHRDRGAEGTIALHPVADPSAFGVVPTDDEGRVTAFVEKPPRDEAPTNEINAGTYVLEASVLERIPEGCRVSIERETFPAMVRDRGLFARPDAGYWLDTGTPSAYLEANFDYLSGKRGPLVGPGLVERGGPGVLLEGESDLEGDVVGPAVVFAGCVVETGARVERSILGPGCVISAGALVADSVLMAGCHVAADAKVSGSVMGPRSIVGQRADVKPVSVLGADAVVSSGTLVDGERVAG